MNGIRRTAAAGAAALVAASLVGASSVSAATHDTTWTTHSVLNGLKLPRGITFDRTGAMYVAESGLPGADPVGTTNGAVDKYTLGRSGAHLAWSSPLLSLYFNDPQRGTDVEGPEGLAAVPGCSGGGDSSAAGADSAAHRTAAGCKVLVVEGNSQQGVAANGGPPGLPQVGHLYQLDGATGAATDRGDIGNQDYTWTNTHKSLFPDDFPDANPYGVLATKTGGDSHSQSERTAATHTYVVDAASNTLDEVSANGTVRVIAYIPNEAPAAGLPSRDATPTCAAQGPDGALYIGTLDLLRNFNPPQGFSHVYRVDPRTHESYLSAAHLWASGLTTITSCTFDSAGNFWATELFANNNAGPPGDVVRIPFHTPGHVQHIGLGQLPFPGGIAEGPDHAMYVTTNAAGTSDAIGGVVRLARGD